MIASAGGRDPGSAIDERALEDRLAALEGARSWSPRVVSRLEARIRDPDGSRLFRLNPLAFAAETGTDDEEAIDLFLHATLVGLFDMEWDIVCASCGNTARSFRRLEKMDVHFDCSLCQYEIEAALDEYLQVTFTVSPAIRTIPYHDPAALAVDELVFRWHFSQDMRPTFEGLTFAQLLQSWTRIAEHLEPGATLEFDLDLDAQAIALRDVRQGATALYLLQPRDPAERPGTTVAELSLVAGRFEDADGSLEPFVYRFENTPGPRYRFPGAASLPTGPTRFRIRNETDERAAIWVHEYPVIPDRFRPIEFEPVLTARRLLSTQTFRTLFRSETLPASEALAVADLTFLFTDLHDSTRMYDLVGDATAYNLVRRHFDVLEAVVEANHGAIVKTIGDAIMATFTDAASAVRAALAMHERMATFEGTSVLVLKIGLHHGHALAITSNGQVDYFGQTVNIAARIQGLAEAGELCLSDAVFDAPGVELLLRDHATTREQGSMKGVAEAIPIYRTRLGHASTPDESPPGDRARAP